MTASRGIRNNNPGNIRHNDKNKWQGALPDRKDKSFVTFESPAFGIRAIAVTLTTYYEKHGLSTVGQLISRWAPATENNVDVYVKSVADALDVSPHKVIDVTTRDTMEKLVKAIIKHENGVQPYDDSVIDKGLMMAGYPKPKPLKGSRTLKGSAVSGASIIGIAAAPEVAQQISSVSTQFASMAGAAKWVFLLLALCGIGMIVHARVTDAKGGKR